jgi:hypothetical protein
MAIIHGRDGLYPPDMPDLGHYLREAGCKRRQAGVHDCCTFPADWALRCGRADPMARWRGAYASEAAVEALIFDAGGLAALFAAGMRTAGIPEVDEPAAGDIGVVSLLGQEAGAIFSGRRWMFVGEAGIAGASLERELVTRIWRP